MFNLVMLKKWRSSNHLIELNLVFLGERGHVLNGQLQEQRRVGQARADRPTRQRVQDGDEARVQTWERLRVGRHGRDVQERLRKRPPRTHRRPLQQGHVHRSRLLLRTRRPLLRNVDEV